MRTLLLTLCTAFTAFACADAPKQPVNPEPYVKDLPLIYIQGFMKKYPLGNNYKVKKIHVRGMCFELEDGSLWEVQPLGPQSRSFFEQKQHFKFDFVEDLVKKWEPGDQLTFFQRRADVEELMVYNATRDQLIDVTPFLPPVDPSLTLQSIDHEAKSVVLSDGSKWEFKTFDSEYQWEAGDPILIAKPSPWTNRNAPYVLINLCACRCDSTVEHIHPNRLATYPVKG